MKTRAGFVSNSSSSSFIVAFEMKPEWDSDLDNMLFGEAPEGEINWFENPYYSAEYNCECEKRWRGEIIAAIVMKELTHQKPLTREQAIEVIDSGWFDGRPEYDHGEDLYEKDGDSDAEKERKFADREKHWEEQGEKRKEAAVKVYDRFVEGLPEGTELYTFEYSDNDGTMFSSMEHGDLFRRFKHLRISKH